jgi:hypothetical protein
MKIRETLSSAIIVVFLTLIVWVAADRAVLRSTEMDVFIKVDSPSPNYRVTVLEPSPAVMRVQFKGPAHVLDALKQAEPKEAFHYTLSAAEAREAAGKGRVVLKPKQGFEELVQQGVSAEAFGTSEIVVKVEAIEKIELRVELAAGDKKKVSESFVVKPKEVAAMIPSSERDRASREQLAAVPQLNLELPDLLAGRESTQTAILRPSIPDINVTFIPAQVDVTLRLLAPLDKGTISGIKIDLAGPPAIFAAYDVILVEPVLNNLKIKGPKTDVAALTPADVNAILVLQADDKPNEGSQKLRPLQFHFPEGSRVRLDDDAPPPTATFNLKERTPPSPPKEPKS